jgi:hypothetical protein
MRKGTWTTGLATSLLALSIALPAYADKHGEKRERRQTITTMATVEAVDYDKRELVLKSPTGNVSTVIAGPEVQRLAEIKPGDTIRADYIISLASEMREPTEEEKEEPFVVLEGAGRADADSPPGAGLGRQIRVVATVEHLDREAQTATLRGPYGRALTVRVRDPERMERANVGDTVVLTYTEAVALSVEKIQ